jgi:hypothetical protein
MAIPPMSIDEATTPSGKTRGAGNSVAAIDRATEFTDIGTVTAPGETSAPLAIVTIDVEMFRATDVGLTLTLPDASVGEVTEA